ncbi:MAG: hypothetical protein FIA99_00555 [Ruminiclostridium sp.]|nr:hypothetical protein [Ruminiclostridium sp.]
MHKTWLLADKKWIMGHNNRFAPKGEFKFVNGVLEKPDEPFFFRDKPWERNGIGGITMLLEDGVYRLWYESWGGDECSDVSLQLCYAESRDGVNFIKPSLGLIEFEGSTDNNIVFSGKHNEYMGFGGHCLFADPTSPPEARYRMMYLCSVNKSNRPEQFLRHMSFAYSADGIRWTNGVPEFRSWINPPVEPFGCDCNCVVYYDPDKRSYVGYFRTWSETDTRGIGYAETNNFGHWPTPRTIYEADELDPLTTDFYGGADTRYESGGDVVHYMFIPAYNHLTEKTDMQLAVSRDGEHYKRHERKSFVANDKKYDSAASYLQHGIITVGDICYVYGEGTTVKHNEDTEGFDKYKGCLYRASVKKDRFTGLKTDSEFEFNIHHFRYEGGTLEITVNADIGRDGYIKCALVEGNEKDVIGFTESDCTPVEGDSIAHKIRFSNGVPGEKYRGVDFEIRIYMKNATLYSVSIDQ